VHARRRALRDHLRDGPRGGDHDREIDLLRHLADRRKRLHPEHVDALPVDRKDGSGKSRSRRSRSMVGPVRFT
jgi:hypothetical protein